MEPAKINQATIEQPSILMEYESGTISREEAFKGLVDRGFCPNQVREDHVGRATHERKLADDLKRVRDRCQELVEKYGSTGEDRRAGLGQTPEGLEVLRAANRLVKAADQVLTDSPAT